DARQHHAIRLGNFLWIAGDNDRLIVSRLTRGALEGFRRRVQIARTLIDDGDAHRFTLPVPGIARSHRKATAVRAVPARNIAAPAQRTSWLVLRPRAWPIRHRNAARR